ncbi:MAG: class I SAM-dependent methyltransferase [Acidobacteriota bacterium]
MKPREQPTLTDVPETMLWTLHNRASEAMRHDCVLEDEKAIEIFRAIDYDYRRHFGRPEPSHALRSLVFDHEIREFLNADPHGVVVNLGEGLETQRYRVDGASLWLTVDLPEAIEIRERFIEPDERHQHLALSALDRAWIDAIPEGRSTLVTAQGLFMYFTEADVRSLLTDLSRDLPGCCIVFDTIPRWFSRKTLSRKGLQRTRHYRAPAMPWGIDRGDIEATMGSWFGDRAEITDIGYPVFPRGISRCMTWLWFTVPRLRRISPTIVKVQMAS